MGIGVPENPIGRLIRDERAVGVIEFAVIAPFLIVLFLGVSEISLAIDAYRKVQATDAQIAELIAMRSEITAAEIDDIFELADSAMLPFDASKVGIAVASVRNQAQDEATMLWHRSNDGETFIDFDRVPPASGMSENGFILVQANYTYVPFTQLFFGEGFTMRTMAISRLRLTNSLECTGC